ncbi:MAG TPA: phosphonate ABC transporter, permease protein PhnE [Firmicutes bacterium]|nr:phosphonate ABC transporter, permease protein PhnE [Bacillota bacterium]
MNVIKNIFKPQKITLDNGKEIQPPRPMAPFVVIGFIIALLFAAQVTGFDFAKLMKRGEEFFVILTKMFPPDLNFIKQVIPPLVETIKMSLLGSLIGCLFAFPVAILSSSNINKNKFILSFTRVILSILRTIPTLIIALFATYVFGLGTFAGTVAITIFTFGIVVKMLYEKIETVDMGPFEAMEAVGATKLESFNSAITPQILPTYLSTCLYCLEINVRAATILGYVGAGGIGLLLKEKIGWREYDKVGMILVLLFITVVIIENTSRYIRERLG